MSKNIFHNVKITAIKTVVPKDFINIDDEIEYYDNSEKKLNRVKNILGCGKRHTADENTTAVDLCRDAANLLFEELHFDRNEIDTLLFVSQSHDYILPASANVLHGMLNLPENCAALDLLQGCSGYVYALWIAHSLIQSGSSKKLLLLSGDTKSKNSFQANRLTAPLFGDSGSATLLEYTEEKSSAYFILGSNGQDWEKIIMPAGGYRIPIDEEIIKTIVKDDNGFPWKLNQTLMDGLGVFRFVMNYVPQSIKDTLDFANCTKEDIELYILHQANKQIVESVAKKAEIPLEKTPTNTFKDYANCACNSVAVNITQNCKNVKGNILLCSFGTGMSWASAIIDLSNIKNLGISFAKPVNTTIKELKEYWYKKFLTKGEL